MKILHVITSMDPATGGPCQVIRNTVPELENFGAKNTIVCLDSNDSIFLQNESLNIHALGSGKGPWAYNIELARWLVQNLQHFDVVISHGLWLYTTFAVQQSLQRYQKYLNNQKESNKKIPKFYLMPHGMLDPYFQKAKGRRLKAIRNWMYWKFVEGKVINDATGLLFTCETELRLARKTFTPYHPKAELIVGLGIHKAPEQTIAMQDAFYSRCPELLNKPFILSLSRIHEKKGVDLLVTAYKNLLEKGVLLPRLVIAGPGAESDYGKGIIKMVNQSTALKSLISFPGMLSGDSKWGAFYSSDAFILPSHQENFGIAVVEAMSCSRPVLISDQVNIWREIETAGGGIVDNDTVEGTMRLLEKWSLFTREQKDNINQRAREAFENIFFVEPAAKRLLDAISNNTDSVPENNVNHLHRVTQ